MTAHESAIAHYEPLFETRLPETCALLRSGPLVVHEWVQRITLHGSRGPLGGFREDSDIDLALHVGRAGLSGDRLAARFRQVLRTSLNHWRGKVELDLAVVFDRSDCGTTCFDYTEWPAGRCLSEGVDCLGIYKIQKGFDGFVTGPASQVRLMYPFMTIWKAATPIA